MHHLSLIQCFFLLLRRINTPPTTTTYLWRFVEAEILLHDLKTLRFLTQPRQVQRRVSSSVFQVWTSCVTEQQFHSVRSTVATCSVQRRVAAGVFVWGKGKEKGKRRRRRRREAENDKTDKDVRVSGQCIDAYVRGNIAKLYNKGHIRRRRWRRKRKNQNKKKQNVVFVVFRCLHLPAASNIICSTSISRRNPMRLMSPTDAERKSNDRALLSVLKRLAPCSNKISNASAVW